MEKENQTTLSVRNVTKKYGAVTVLKDISVDVRDKELLVLLGPSGCGKTTLLKIIAGLLDHDSGELFIKGKNVTKIPAYNRDIGLVFQNYALFPHMTVANNVAYGLKMRGIKKTDMVPRVKEALALVRLEGFENRSIKSMSGGQQQRVALARALVLNPSLLLMDEPLSNLDAKLRAVVRVEIAQIQRKLGITSILVTHDQTEAMTMGDRIILMYEGSVRQEGLPSEIFEKPKDVFVASFIGSPQINLMDVVISDGMMQFTDEGNKISLQQLSHFFAPDINQAVLSDRTVIAGIRPEGFNLESTDTDTCPLNGTVTFIENLGSDFYVHLKMGDKEIVARTAASDYSGVTEGMRIGLNFKPHSVHLFDAETTNRIV